MTASKLYNERYNNRDHIPHIMLIRDNILFENYKNVAKAKLPIRPQSAVHERKSSITRPNDDGNEL